MPVTDKSQPLASALLKNARFKFINSMPETRQTARGCYGFKSVTQLNPRGCFIWI